MIEPFTYACLLHSRSVLQKREPTRDEISMLLYAFQAWAAREEQRDLCKEWSAADAPWPE